MVRILFPYECPDYDTKKADVEAPILEPCVMWSTSSLPLLPGPLCLGAVTPDGVLSMGKKLTFRMGANKWFTLNRIVRNRTILTVRKRISNVELNN